MDAYHLDLGLIAVATPVGQDRDLAVLILEIFGTHQ